jgi:hypothetical protein
MRRRIPWPIRWRRRRRDASSDALATAQEQNEHARRQGRQAEQIAAGLRRLRHENHFAEAIRHALEDR